MWLLDVLGELVPLLNHHQGSNIFDIGALWQTNLDQSECQKKESQTEFCIFLCFSSGPNNLLLLKSWQEQCLAPAPATSASHSRIVQSSDSIHQLLTVLWVVGERCTSTLSLWLKWVGQSTVIAASAAQLDRIDGHIRARLHPSLSTVCTERAVTLLPVPMSHRVTLCFFLQWCQFLRHRWDIANSLQVTCVASSEFQRSLF